MVIILCMWFFSASSPRVAFAGPGQDGGQEAVSFVIINVEVRLTRLSLSLSLS